jgi:hypothetical protein
VIATEPIVDRDRGLGGEPSQGAAACVGVCLMAAETQVAGWFAEDGPAVVSLVPPEAHAIPPAVLVPRFAGEPVRADVHWPPHPRGCGEPWPPESRVPDHGEPGRFPLGYAWRMVAKGTCWSWQASQTRTSVGPAEAVAHAVAAIVRGHAAPDSIGPHALVVPHHLACAAQQELLDAVRKLGVDVKLLWRPIAAAHAWCSHFRQLFTAAEVVRAGEDDHPVGSILALHMGLDQWELAVIDVLQSRGPDGPMLLPARRRPVGAALPSYGLELMHRLARRTLEMSHQQPSAARVWELVWCTSWMKVALAMLAGGDFAEVERMPALSPHVLTREFIRQQCRQATQHVFGPMVGVPGLLDHHLGPSPRFEEVRDWCDGHRRAVAAEALIGAVVTGPMANVIEDRAALGPHYLEKIWPGAQNMLVEGREVPDGVLAHGAAAFAQHLAASRGSESVGAASETTSGVTSGGGGPFHRDTLPRIRMAAVRQGKAAWIDLLAENDRPVPACRRWHRPDTLPPVRITAGTRAIDLALWHQDHATVQRAAAVLPHRLDRNETGRLHVSVEPAAGQPVIELRPDRPGVFDGVRLRFDLRAMRDTRVTPDEFLKKLGG